MFDPFYLQIVTVIFSLLTLFFQRKLHRIKRYKRAWDMPVTIWAVLTLIFYMILFGNNAHWFDVHIINTTFFSDWSTALRMYGAGTFFWSTYFRYKIHLEETKP